VQAALDEMVALKLEPQKNAADKELFQHFRSTGYPTLLFLTPEGEELDRFDDFMPPDDFLATIDRIKKGDTFAALRSLGARVRRSDGSL
jgi:thioredoxin-related protein